MRNVLRFKRRGKRRRRPWFSWLPFNSVYLVSAFFIGGVIGSFLFIGFPDAASELKYQFKRLVSTVSVAVERESVQSINFQICQSAIRINCVVDGDTIWFGGEKIRIADIDTPEIFSPKCTSEAALGQRAKHRLLDLLNEGPIEVVRAGFRNRDRYGRLLRRIERDGHSLGDVLVSEGLARRWDGSRRPWC